MNTELADLKDMDPQTGLRILRRIGKERSLLSGLRAMHIHLGDLFQIGLPAFQPVVAVGPDYNRQIFVAQRDRLLWRNESDPVCRLLRRGLLVVDGEEHGHLRALMEPVLQRGMVAAEAERIWKITAQYTANWAAHSRLDMLVEMRKLTLIILVDLLFGVDIRPDLKRLWRPVLRAIDYISPGPWLVWPNMPRPGYQRDLSALDAYLHQMIRRRRREDHPPDNLLTRLVQSDTMSDDRIRDQLLTMLIAGHDTSTALLAWTLYLLGDHPAVLSQVQQEVDEKLPAALPGNTELRALFLLDMVIKEALRLFPPIHVGNRVVASDLQLGSQRIPAGTRLMASIFLSHRHPDYWPEADAFCPRRFDRRGRGGAPHSMAYLPFGGGPRNCIGAAFAQVEARAVMAYLLRHFNFELLNRNVHIRMRATLEPRPGVLMRVSPRERGLA